MKGLIVSIVAFVCTASLVIAGCAQAGPAPTPTRASVAPTKAAEPTKASPAPTKMAEPTKAAAAPISKVDFPTKGKSITMIIPWDAGGSGDVAGRLLAAALEKDLGVPVPVVNKPGASSQVGLTELARSEPNGYTIGETNMSSTVLTYLDPERKTAYSRKDFEPLANLSFSPTAVTVGANSPFKTLKDLLDTAKANPERVKAGTTGLLSNTHMDLALLEKAAGVKLNAVHFSGNAPAITALLGNHIDATVMASSSFTSQLKSGEVRLLGIMAKQESRFYPGVKTLEALGYKLYSGAFVGFSAPGGTPRTALDVLSSSVKKAVESEDLKKKIEELNFELNYMDAAGFAAYWSEVETAMRPLVEQFRKK